MRVLCLGLYYIFYWIICFLMINFLYFGDQSSVWCGVSEDVFPFCRLPFCLIDSVLCLTETFQFHEVPFIVDCSVCDNVFSPVLMHSRLLPTFSSIRFSILGLFLRSLIHLDLYFVQGYIDSFAFFVSRDCWFLSQLPRPK